MPDDNPAESYRPPIDTISERFLRSFEADARKRHSEEVHNEARHLFHGQHVVYVVYIYI